MKPIRVVVEAQDELISAASFYDSQRAGLGQAFLRSIDKAVDEIREHPARWPLIGQEIRRRLVGRFPYAVIYRDDPDEIVILAVMHLHRRPGYWGKRV
jgi:plasmid stabilization system protein ParE